MHRRRIASFTLRGHSGSGGQLLARTVSLDNFSMSGCIGVNTGIWISGSQVFSVLGRH